MTAPLLQALQARAPWTVAQIHDTVATIAAQARYGPAAHESLLGRLARFLLEKLIEFLRLFQGRGNISKPLIGAVIIVAIAIIARIVVVAQLDDARSRLSRIGVRFGDRVDFWGLASEHAAAGRYGEACHAIYAAVIDGLVGGGFAKFHPSKTSGDYSRELRRSGAPMLSDFRTFARAFDRIMFGETAVRADDYTLLRDLAERTMRMRRVA